VFAAVLLLAVGPVVGQQFLHRGVESEENEARDFIRQREAWFFEPRASAQGHVPNGLRLEALAERDARIRREGTFADRVARVHPGRAIADRAAHSNISISSTQWTPIGPQPLQNESPFGNASGRVTAVAIDPCDPNWNTVYIGAADGGVWRTADGGSTWTPLTDAQASLASGSIALANPGTDCTMTTVIYGTGEENFAYDSLYGAGVLISADSGNTWTPDATFSAGRPQGSRASAPYIGSISVQPGNSSVMIAGVYGTPTIPWGIWRSTDGGMHWTLQNPASPSIDIATAVAFDTNDATGATAYAAMGYPDTDSGLVAAGDCAADPCNGVFRSTDGGASWTRLTGLDTAINAALGAGADAKYGRISIALSSPMPGQAVNPVTTEIFAAIADGTTGSTRFLAFAKSVNAGDSWTVLTQEPFCDRGSDSGQCYYDMALAIQPGNPQVLFAGGAAGAIAGSSTPEPTLIRSMDGGMTWADVSANNGGDTSNPQIHVDHHAIAFSPDGRTIYVGNDGGVWRSADAMTAAAGSQHWANLNAGLQTMQFYPGVTPHPSNPNVVFGGTQDNGSEEYSGNLTWTDPRTCGDGGWTAIGPVTASAFTVFLACDNVGNNGTIWKSANSGGNYATADSGINFSTSVDFIPPVVLDPSAPQNAYFGTTSLWQSQDGAGTWTAMAGGASLTLSGSSTDYITAMAVAPSDSNTVYAGSRLAVVYATTNALKGASATFTKVSAGLPYRSLTQLVVDPINAMKAYAAFSGFSGFGDTPGHIFETTDGGGSWTSIDGDLPNVPVNDLVIDPGDPEEMIYAATDVGVFVTANGGAHWSTLAAGLPNDQVMSVRIQASWRLLVAGTHGRGAWEFALPAVPLNISSISPVSIAAGSAQFRLTVDGASFTANSVVNFAGTALVTDASGAPTTLVGTVPAALVASAGTVPVTVTDGTQTSNSLNFTVTAPPPDFTFGTIVSNPANASVAAGGNVTYTVHVTALDGFTGTVALACTGGVPSNAHCSGGSATASAPGTVTISTAADSVAMRAHRSLVTPLPPTPAGGKSAAIARCALAMLVFVCGAVRGRRSSLALRISRVMLIPLAAMILAFAIAACGGGNGGGGGSGQSGTPAGAYTITITGTSGSLTHSTTVSLTVQ
jgi:hypothetical protein